ncbi:MAG TPA: tRNA pseudouridine(55) synthase TruB, partial [Gaiellales bacterium]|nr:tRNA pseudouridine(55) synthase TruB [Gaiellales bacterium]
LLVDKPAGQSSFGVLRGLRPALGRKLGHAGTLDPFATGLLLVVAGRATRLATYLSGLDKGYDAVVQFGAVSTTLDPEGEITPAGPPTDAEAVAGAAAGLVGEIVQAVPAASAVKVDGERAYARMRRGEAVAPPPRRVTIHRLDVNRFDGETQRAAISVRCSKGTYVRQLAADLGTATGAGAYCLELRRTAVGGFDLADAGTPAEIAREPLGRWYRSAADALPHLPARALDDAEQRDVSHGRALDRHGEDGFTRLVHGGELRAVAEPRGERLQPVVVL